MYWLLRGGKFRQSFFLLQDILFDLQLGIDTASPMAVSAMSLDTPSLDYATEYAGVPRRVLQEALSGLEMDCRNFTFLDYGSGKGRALLIAATFEFERVIGVEFEPKLHSIACDNIGKTKNRAARAVESVLADATKFPVPNNPLVIHFFNPFRGPVLKAVVDEIERSYSANPRPIVIIYIDPKYRAVFDERRFLALASEKRSRGYLYPNKYLVYRTR